MKVSPTKTGSNTSTLNVFFRFSFVYRSGQVTENSVSAL